MIILKLVTLDAQRHDGGADTYYVLWQCARYVLQTHGTRRSFHSLPALAHVLGGMVSWERWTPESQLQLEHLQLRKAF